MSGRILTVATGIIWIVSSTELPAQISGASNSTRGKVIRCRSSPDILGWAPCIDVANPANAPQQSSDSDAWRLARTPNPSGGRDAVSITRIAEIPGSDLQFAGLMFRCGEHAIEPLVVLVRPLQPYTHPKVIADTGSDRVQLSGSVMPPGVLVLLPSEVTELAAGPWQGGTDLALTVEDSDGPVHGIVRLSGLPGALQKLRANCPP